MRVMKNKSVLRYYLITYVGVTVAVCAVLGVVLMLLSADNLSRQEQAYMEARLTSACEDLAYQIELMNYTAFHVGSHVVYQPTYLAKSPYNDVLMLESFSRLAGASVIQDTYLLHYVNTQSIYTPNSKIPLDLYLRAYMPETTVEKFISLMHGKDGFLHIGEEEPTKLVYKRTLSFRRSVNKDTAYLIFLIDKDMLVRRYSNLFGLSEHVLLEVDGIVLLDGREEVAEEDYQCNLVREGRNIRFAMQKNTANATSYPLRVMLRVVIGLSLFFAIISVYLAIISYSPIKRLADKVGVEGGQAGNEIQAITQAIDNIIRQTDISLDLLTGSFENISRLQENLRQQVLLRVLSGEYDPALSQRMVDAGIDLGGKLCVMYIAYDNALTTEELNRQINELSDNDAKMYLVPLTAQRGWALLLTAKCAEELLAACDMVSDILSSQFPTLHITQGRICSMVQELAHSLVVAESAHGQEENDTSPQVSTTLEKLKESMDKGAQIQAYATLDRLMDCIEKDYPSMLIRSYRLAEITYHIMIYGHSKGYAFNMQEVADFLSYRDTDSAKKVLAEIVGKICKMSPQSMDAQIPAAYKVVIKYIEKHALEQNICLDSVATACGISTKQVSRITRSVVDMSFKEYVSSLRMRKATALLREGTSSTDAARQVGYSDLSHFTKVFRTRIGLTPGQYRDQYAQAPIEEKIV